MSFRQLAAPGIPTLIVAVFFFAGLQLFFFGVLGEYIASIHSQVRKRPLVIERERINFEELGADREGALAGISLHAVHSAHVPVPDPGSSGDADGDVDPDDRGMVEPAQSSERGLI